MDSGHDARRLRSIIAITAWAGNESRETDSHAALVSAEGGQYTNLQIFCESEIDFGIFLSLNANRHSQKKVE